MPPGEHLHRRQRFPQHAFGRLYLGTKVSALEKLVASNNDVTAGLESDRCAAVTVNLIGGVHYWIAVDGRLGAVWQHRSDVKLGAFQNIVNSSFASAINTRRMATNSGGGTAGAAVNVRRKSRPSTMDPGFTNLRYFSRLERTGLCRVQTLPPDIPSADVGHPRASHSLTGRAKPWGCCPFYLAASISGRMA